MTGDSGQGHGMLVIRCDGCTDYLPRASLARMALEALFTALDEERPPGQEQEGRYKAM